ncbi:hypothetical protein ACEPAF_1093 [Sanghuangporus sanghuang]
MSLTSRTGATGILSTGSRQIAAAAATAATVPAIALASLILFHSFCTRRLTHSRRIAVAAVAHADSTVRKKEGRFVKSPKVAITSRTPRRETVGSRRNVAAAVVAVPLYRLLVA